MNNTDPGVWDLFEEWVGGRCAGTLVYAALPDREDYFHEPSRRFGLMSDETKAAILRAFRLADLNPKTLIRLRRSCGEVAVELEMVQMFGSLDDQINNGETMYASTAKGSAVSDRPPNTLRCDPGTAVKPAF